MTDFEKLLNDVIQGKGNLAPVRNWLDKNLPRPDCDHGVLLKALDKALESGLFEPVARAIRTHIESVAPAPAPKKSNSPTDQDFPFELEEMAPREDSVAPAEKTQLDPKSGAKTQIMNRGDKTVITAPHEDTLPANERTRAIGDRTTIQQPASEEAITMRTDKGRTVITSQGGREDPTGDRKSVV